MLSSTASVVSFDVASGPGSGSVSLIAEGLVGVKKVGEADDEVEGFCIIGKDT